VAGDSTSAESLRVTTGGSRPAPCNPCRPHPSRCSGPPHSTHSAQAFNALRPGGGRTNICESENELSNRLAEDGAELSRENLAAALKALEGSRDPGGLDTGRSWMAVAYLLGQYVVSQLVGGVGRKPSHDAQ
jgi:hypothetical protein